MALSKVYTDMILGHDLEVTGEITANSLEVTGDIKANALEVTGDITANAFIGDGSALTGIESVPSGLIAMWYGSVASIPAGYFLCDGANGTPDLRDRFVIGAGSTHAPDESGGGTATLALDNIPEHTHGPGDYSGTVADGGDHAHSGNTSAHNGHTHNVGGNTSTNGSHTHSVNGNTSNNGAHTHNITPEGNGNSGVWASEAGVFIQNRTSGSAGNHNHSIYGTANGAGNHYHSWGGGSNTAGAHGHTIATNTEGKHNHTFSVTGGKSSAAGLAAPNSFAVTPKYYALAYIMKG